MIRNIYKATGNNLHVDEKHGCKLSNDSIDVCDKYGNKKNVFVVKSRNR